MAMNKNIKKLRAINSGTSDSGESCYDEQIFCILLHVVEGIHFYTREIRDTEDRSLRVREKVVMNASLNGVQFEVEGSPAPTMETTIFNSNCIWECDLQAIKRIKTDNRPVKVLFYINNPQVERKVIGNLLLPLRGLPIVTSITSVQNKMFWHKLNCLGNEWRSQKPEVYLMMLIVKKSLLNSGEIESLLMGNKKSARSTALSSPERSNTSSMLQSQANLYVSQIVQLGLLQVGNNPTVDCNIIEVILLLKELKNVNKLIKMVPGRDENKPLVIIMDFVGNITSIDIKVNDKDLYTLCEKLGLRFKTSLRSLRLYFQRIFYLPINIYYNGVAIANYRLDFSKLLPEDSYFNEQRKYARNGVIMFDRLCKVVSGRDPKPIVEYTFSVEILSSPITPMPVLNSNDLLSALSFPSGATEDGSRGGIVSHPEMPLGQVAPSGYSTLSTQNMQRFIEMNGNEKVAAWCDHVVLSTQNVETPHSISVERARSSESDVDQYEMHKNVYYKNIEENVYTKDSVARHQSKLITNEIAKQTEGRLQSLNNSDEQKSVAALKSTRSEKIMLLADNAEDQKVKQSSKSLPLCNLNNNEYESSLSDEDQMCKSLCPKAKSETCTKTESNSENMDKCGGMSERFPVMNSMKSTSDLDRERFKEDKDFLKSYTFRQVSVSELRTTNFKHHQVQYKSAAKSEKEQVIIFMESQSKKNIVKRNSNDQLTVRSEGDPKAFPSPRTPKLLSPKPSTHSPLSNAEAVNGDSACLPVKQIQFCSSPRRESYVTILHSPKPVESMATSPSFEQQYAIKSFCSETAINTDPVAFVDSNEFGKLHLNVLANLEVWKTQQMALFTEELKHKESCYLQNVEEQCQAQRTIEQTTLGPNILRCEELSQKLNEIQKMLSKQGKDVQYVELEERLIQIQKGISQHVLDRECDRVRESKRDRELFNVSNAKREVRENYQRKFEQLEKHITGLKYEMEKQLQEFQTRNESMRAENERLAREKLDLMERICDMESQLGNLKEKRLGADELRKVLEQMRIQNERYLQMEKSKNFYKEQWRRCARRMHKLKLTLLEKEQQLILGNGYCEPEADFDIRSFIRQERGCEDEDTDAGAVADTELDDGETSTRVINMHVDHEPDTTSSAMITSTSSSTEFTLAFSDSCRAELS